MVLPAEAVIQINPVADVIKSSVLTAFTFLSALSIRDVLVKTLEAAVPTSASERLIFVYFYTGIVILVTLILAWVWQSSGD